jgi:AmmeMemoRadiSam system protein A
MSSFLTPPEKEELLRIARRSIETALAGGAPPEPEAAPVAAEDARGVFVTLTANGRLRGCIGTLVSPAGVGQAVAEYARHAAFDDPRFRPISAAEWPGIEIEISVLAPPRLAQGVEDIRVGRDGLIIEHQGRRGLLLPQVAVEWGFSAEQFLAELSRKAGLLPGAWKEPDARLYAFEAEVFGERENSASDRRSRS